MQYTTLGREQRHELMASLATMASALRKAFASLTREAACARGPGDSFSPVEQVWHLADLEREGFAIRIARLRKEDEPRLADFDGAKVAEARNHRALPLAAGLHAFEVARAANLAVFASLSAVEWSRSGTQDGLGAVSLCDMPSLMRQHDEAHLAEIAEWQRFRRQDDDC